MSYLYIFSLQDVMYLTVCEKLCFLFRFSEIYVDEMDDASDLKTLVAYYLNNLNLSSDVISGIVK